MKKYFKNFPKRKGLEKNSKFTIRESIERIDNCLSEGKKKKKIKFLFFLIFKSFYTHSTLMQMLKKH